MPAVDSCARGSIAPIPVVHRYIPSASPRGTTFVSPPTISTPACRAASAMAWTSSRSTPASRPSSRIIETVSACGRAPAIARSLAVPLTASSPIEPPGKRSGETTKLSEVIATLAPSTSTVPASPRAASVAEPSAAKAGSNNPSINVCVALPPAPWASVICLSRNRAFFARAVSMIWSTRSSRLVMLTPPPPPPRSGAQYPRYAFEDASYRLALPGIPAEVVVRRARALGRHHAGADRVLGRAGRSEHLALPRLDHPLEHLAALAGLGIGDPHVGGREALLGVELRVGVGQAQGALRDEAQPPPLKVRTQREHLGHHLERAEVALLGDDSLVLVLHLASAAAELLEDHQDRLQDVERLEARDDDRAPVVDGDEAKRPRAHHRAHVART